MTQRQCVVLGDVVDSREIAERREFERTLNETLDTINNQFSDRIKAPFMPLKGIDEIGGVLSSVQPIGEIQKILSTRLHPEQIRIVAVVGQVETYKETDDVSEMDGSAFSRADFILSKLESESLTFRLSGNNTPVDSFISDEICLLDMIRSKWSSRKMEVVRKYDEANNQKEVAKELEISAQAVSNHLRDVQNEEIRRIEERLFENIRNYPEISTNESNSNHYSL